MHYKKDLRLAIQRCAEIFHVQMKHELGQNSKYTALSAPNFETLKGFCDIEGTYKRMFKCSAVTWCDAPESANHGVSVEAGAAVRVGIEVDYPGFFPLCQYDHHPLYSLQETRRLPSDFPSDKIRL
ncbi:hypothetical protein PIB30_031007 [Stylosanthes scabra]|uniref:Uncharacterized protein n=1 Tax=Stylosanthes scabra TaxID=79078 RepID=A0ABU6W9S3_9FABA|nr:hypothetical protein [Stylosanthes scabra]